MENIKYELECPITLCPINMAGITYFGNIYDYDAISCWLKKNNTDPMNGLELPTNTIVKYDISDCNMDKIEEKKKEALQKFETVTKFTTRVKNIHHTYSKYIECLNLINDYDNEKLDNWGTYISIKNYTFESNTNCKNDDGDDIIKRPSNTGTGYNFIHLNDYTKKECNFFEVSFDFANISYCTFKKCNFHNCTFIGATFEKVTFKDCVFFGLDTVFYKSIVKKKVFFCRCKIQNIENTILVVDKYNLLRVLSLRLLDIENIKVLET